MAALRIGIAGGSGYGGGELIRLLLGHPRTEVAFVTSRRNAGRPVHAVHEHLLGSTDLVFTDRPVAEQAREVDGVFFAMPHGEGAKLMPAVLDAAPDARIIDLSGDFRLDSVAAWEAAYGRDHPAPELGGTFTYGLPEIGRDRIAISRRIANPGCFATASILALLPLAEAGLLSGRVALTGVTGSSGSGADPKEATHHPVRAEDFRSYRALRHQHVPEIEAALSAAGASGPTLAMVPHSAPFVRGIFMTATVFPSQPVTGEALATLYGERYAPEPFVRIRKETPRVQVVKGTNYCDISVAASGDGGALVAMSAIDNLVKGMAGQAVQNLNLMFGFAETMGLEHPGMLP